MTFLPFGEWLPDAPDFTNPGTRVATNVYARTAQSYGPLRTPVAASGALGNRCLGSYSTLDSAGNSYVFAADKSKLYLMKAGSTSFVDVSKSAGGPYTLDDDAADFWSATAFGERVVFTNRLDPVQTYLVGTDTAFSDLSAQAPKARFCAVIRDFLMLGYCIEGNAFPRRVQWSAIGDPQSWPASGTNAAIEVQSDSQDLEQSDLGFMSGLVGGVLANADGAAFFERGIYRIVYVGSPPIFNFTVSQGAAGTVAPLSLVAHRGIVEYLGEDGFYAYDGAQVVPIGAQKVDKTFFDDIDASAVSRVLGVSDPINKLTFWAYSGAGANGLYNRLIIRNWALNRWTFADLTDVPIEWLLRSLSIGYSLDSLDALGYTLDTLPFSLDSRAWTGGAPLLGMFDSSHRLALPTGNTLAATIETTELQPFAGRRAKVLSARPIGDAAGAAIAVGSREQLSAAVSFAPAVAANTLGACPQRATGRYLRGRLTLPAATEFTHLQGIDVDLRPEGSRR